MEKPKVYMQKPMDMNEGSKGNDRGKQGSGQRGIKGRKNGTTVIA